jgi:phosphotransferase system enzyme I (PtsI)
MPDAGAAGERIFRGIPVSPGVCRGKILVLPKPHPEVVARREVSEDQIGDEINRLEQAILDTRHQIQAVQRRLAEGLGAQDASIFDAHLLVLDDPTLIEEVTRLITHEKVVADYAFQQVADKYVRTLSAIEDEYLRERASDLRDVTSRILHNLVGLAANVDLTSLSEPCVIVSYELTPSQTAQLNREMVLGFATDVGGRTSHTAIMARSLGIPAVVGLRSASDELVSGGDVLLDGFNGQVVVSPTDQTLFEYGQLARKRDTLQEKLRETHDAPAVTLDGTRVVVSANVEQPGDTNAVVASGAEGVGLFRTEYLFINRETMPSEEEQYQAYHEVATALKPNPVIIRTLDLGGDKFASHLQVPVEMNPFLGCRAIRFCLQERDIFRAQLRAILRAGVEGNVRIMYPMISGLDELNRTSELLEEFKAELKAEGLPYSPDIETGAMIEIPSAVLAAESFARRMDFLSIGTNDLIQYALAVDRMNEKIAHLYEPTHPAIVRLIKMTADAGRSNGIWVGVCGEMAGDAMLTPLLLGLGVSELSAVPTVVPQIKYLIRRLKMSDAESLAKFALQCESGAEILARSRELVRRAAPSLFESLRPQDV